MVDSTPTFDNLSGMYLLSNDLKDDIFSPIQVDDSAIGLAVTVEEPIVVLTNLSSLSNPD